MRALTSLELHLSCHFDYELTLIYNRVVWCFGTKDEVFELDQVITDVLVLTMVLFFFFLFLLFLFFLFFFLFLIFICLCNKLRLLLDELGASWLILFNLFLLELCFHGFLALILLCS